MTPYGLTTGTRYHWRVQVWDETGEAAGAAQSWFETGLLHPDDWVAVCIGRDEQALPVIDPPTDRSHPAAELRRLRLHRHRTQPPIRHL